MRLFIEPAETLLFRTGRPFDAGEIGYAETLFPPTLETVQGALRAMIASRLYPGKPLSEVFSQADIKDLIGDNTPGNYGQFRITHFSLGKRNEAGNIVPLYPVPSHILEEHDTGLRLRLELLPDDEKKYLVASNMPEGMQLLGFNQNTSSKLEPLRGWLLEDDLQRALREDEDISKLAVIGAEAIYSKEVRIGIGIENKTKTTREGLLYQVQMIRMKSDYGFIVDFRFAAGTNQQETEADARVQAVLPALEKNEWGWMTLGGEQRAARFTVIHTTFRRRRPAKLLYLVTPAYFHGGWKPQHWQAVGKEPIAASITQYQPIGGWALDPKNGGGANKVMRRCVPAGSVYFFPESLEMPPSFTDYGIQIGYGITYTGDVQQ